MDEAPTSPEAGIRYHWFSLSYRGESTRTELWLMTLFYFVAYVVAMSILEHSAPLACQAAFDLGAILFFFPLTIRRARQLGAVWYGVALLVLQELEEVSNVLWSWLDVLSESLHLPYLVVQFILYFPICFLGRWPIAKTAA